MNATQAAITFRILFDGAARCIRNGNFSVARDYVTRADGALFALDGVAPKKVMERAEILNRLLADAASHTAELNHIKASVARTMTEINAGKEAA